MVVGGGERCRLTFCPKPLALFTRNQEKAAVAISVGGKGEEGNEKKGEEAVCEGEWKGN